MISAHSSPRSRPAGRCWTGWLRGVLAAVAFAQAGAGLAQNPSEYRIKAAFLFNFAKFAEWPARSFPTAGTPIMIATACTPGFVTDLQQIVRGRTVNGRSIEVWRVQQPEEVRRAHIVFVCGDRDAELTRIADVVRRLPILTVGESDLFASRGGMIRFVVVQDRVRFEIDMEAVERSGLDLSAQLQKLAVTVRGSPGEEAP